MDTSKPGPLRERGHLTDAELAALAVPAGISPEALPAHLSECLACTRALSEWKEGLAAIADETGSFESRTAEEWEEASRATMSRIRRARSAPSPAWRWAVAAAAAIFVAVLALPLRSGWGSRPGSISDSASTHTVRSARPDADGTELSQQDQADDLLLRDVARMSRAEDDLGDPLDSLAPEPRGVATRGNL
jgi:hypothetical protein